MDGRQQTLDSISFDGQTFHVYDSIVEYIFLIIFVQQSCIDSANTKWFGTENGLDPYDNMNWFLYDTLNSGLPDNMVLRILN